MLRQAYAYYRRQLIRPTLALRRAREDVANGKKFYNTPEIWKRPTFNPWNGTCRFVDNNELDNYRFVGEAHKVAPRSIRHTGWWCDEYQDTKATGVVFLLPHGRYIYGYKLSDQDGAYLDFDYTDCEITAANMADDMAQRVAEEEREYHEKADREFALSEARERLSELRHEILRLVHELKSYNHRPTIDRALQYRLMSLLKERREQFKILNAD